MNEAKEPSYWRAAGVEAENSQQMTITSLSRSSSISSVVASARWEEARARGGGGQ